LWDKISGFVVKYGPVVIDFFKDLWGIITDFVDEYGPVVKQFFVDLWGSFTEFAKELGPLVLDALKEVWASIKTFAEEWGPVIKGFFSSGAWKDLFDKIPTWVKVIGTLYTGLKLLKSLFEGPTGLVVGVAKLGMKLAGLLAILSIKRKFSGDSEEGLWSRIKGVFSGGEAEATASAPAELAEGGVVDRTGLAIVHEGEAFIPKQYRAEGLSEQTGKDMLFVMQQMLMSLNGGFARVANGLAEGEDALSVGTILGM